MTAPSPNTSTPNFSLYPLAWLAISFAFGIFIANFLTFPWQIYLAVCLIPTVFTIVFFKHKFAAIFLIISFAALGALSFQTEKQSVAPNRLKILYENNELISGEPLEITGVLQVEPELAVGGFFLILKTESAIYKSVEKEVSGNIRLFAPVLDDQIARKYENLRLHHGAKIRVACALRRGSNYLNPGSVSFEELLDQKELDATGIIKSPLLIENLGDAGNFNLLAGIYQIRSNLILEIKRNFSVSTSGILIASLLGNRYHLDRSTSEIFREGGIFHFLVISGLHITFIGGLTVLLVRLFTRNRFWQFSISSAFLWLYSIAVGAQIPVIRAALMFTILHFAYVIFRQGNLLNALGASILILLVWRPSDFFDPSFHLTAASVAAIVATAFPILEKIKAVGEWRPGAETPVPPACSKNLKTFSEMLYWSEPEWRREQSRSIWQANLFKTPLAEKLERLRLQKFLRYVFEMILVSAVVQAWLIPFMVIYFHRISFIGIFLNIWTGILMAAQNLTAIFAVFVAQINGIFALPFIKLTELLNWFLINFGGWFVENNWASIRLPHYAGSMKAVYVLYFLPLIAITVYLNKWKPFKLTENEENNFRFFNFAFSSEKNAVLKISLLSFIALFALVIFHPFSAPAPDGRLRVDFLDVGQGDSALLTMPTGETILIDGGGKINFNALYVKREDEEPEFFEPDIQGVGEWVVSAFLWEKGYDRIDYILTSHADADHIQGLTDVAKNFKIQGAIFGRTPFQNRDFTELYNVLEKRNISLILVSQGDILNFGEVRIEVLYPYRDESAEAVSDNNHSIVLRVNYGARKILFTGDIEKKAESDLLNPPEFLQADVVKAAHHGSKTSSTPQFVNSTSAKVAVIPVGRESPFGHPKPEVVERWKAAGAKVLTTGENGTVSISTNGQDLQLKTFVGKPIFR
jgi:competence protein ComEC